MVLWLEKRASDRFVVSLVFPEGLVDLMTFGDLCVLGSLRRFVSSCERCVNLPIGSY